MAVCKRALMETRGNKDAALNWLFDHPDAEPVEEPTLRNLLAVGVAHCA